MYTVRINNCFSGHFQTIGEAMQCIEKWARPFSHPWIVLDRYDKVFCQG